MMFAHGNAVVDAMHSEATVPARGRHLQGNNECMLSQSLQTPMVADTVVLGTMFTVQTFENPIKLMTMEISANPLETEMDIEIYTKLGHFKGAESDPSQWTKVVDTTVIPTRDGRGTLIPVEEFTSFTMNPNEVHSFFVSVQTPDLRYRRAEEIEADQPFVSDGYLAVNSGIGLAKYGFGGDFFPSRLFCGIFHYTYPTDCNAPSSKTLVSYLFYVQPRANGETDAEIIDETNRLIGDIIKSTLDTMVPLRDEHSLKVEKINTSTIPEMGQAKCPLEKWKSCFSIEVKVTLSRRTTISAGQLQFIFYQKALEVTAQLQAQSLQAEYGGFQPLQASILLAFKGVPSGMALDSEQLLFIEEAFTEYLKEQTVGLTNVLTIGAKIINQRGPQLEQRRFRQLQDDQSTDDWIEFELDIFGVQMPPYDGDADFARVIDDSFDYDRNLFIEDLKRGPHQPGSRVQGAQGAYFENISNVNVRLPDSVESAQSQVLNAGSSPVSSNNAIIILSVTIIMAASVFFWYNVRRHPRRHDEDNSAGSPHIERQKSSGKNRSSVPVRTKHIETPETQSSLVSSVEIRAEGKRSMPRDQTLESEKSPSAMSSRRVTLTGSTPLLKVEKSSVSPRSIGIDPLVGKSAKQSKRSTEAQADDSSRYKSRSSRSSISETTTLGSQRPVLVDISQDGSSRSSKHPSSDGGSQRSVQNDEYQQRLSMSSRRTPSRSGGLKNINVDDSSQLMSTRSLERPTPIEGLHPLTPKSSASSSRSITHLGGSLGRSPSSKSHLLSQGTADTSKPEMARRVEDSMASPRAPGTLSKSRTESRTNREKSPYRSPGQSKTTPEGISGGTVSSASIRSFSLNDRWTDDSGSARGSSHSSSSVSRRRVEALSRSSGHSTRSEASQYSNRPTSQRSDSSR